MIMGIQCELCGVKLSNGIDTFGDLGHELCLTCWANERDFEQSWYGLAPHHHDLTITGSIIGSTVLDPLPESTLPMGEVEIAPGLYFLPDPEVNGVMGIWTQKGFG